MNRSWMKVNRLCPDMKNKFLNSLNTLKQNLLENDGIFYYSYVICGNVNKGTKEEIFHHPCCFITYVIS